MRWRIPSAGAASGSTGLGAGKSRVVVFGKKVNLSPACLAGAYRTHPRRLRSCSGDEAPAGRGRVRALPLEREPPLPPGSGGPPASAAVRTRTTRPVLKKKKKNSTVHMVR
jgi:hypothetical protein